MNRRQIEHIVRAAAAITDQMSFVLIGSQAALVQHARLPEAMTQSPELDIYPSAAPEFADLIAGSIGEGSLFYKTFGYYAQGVGPETAQLPPDWEERAYRLRNAGTSGATASAPELHDLCAAKLPAFREPALREKDRVYVRAALRTGSVRKEDLIRRLQQIDVAGPGSSEAAQQWLATT